MKKSTELSSPNDRNLEVNQRQVCLKNPQVFILRILEMQVFQKNH